LPLMKPVQRIVIRTQIFRKVVTSDRLLEHATKRQTIDDSGLNPKSDNSAGIGLYVVFQSEDRDHDLVLRVDAGIHQCTSEYASDRFAQS